MASSCSAPPPPPPPLPPRPPQAAFVSADTSGDGLLSFDEFSHLLRRLEPRLSPPLCAAVFAEALRASGPGGVVSPGAFAQVAASHGLGLARQPPAVEAAAAPHVSELQLLAELWENTALRLDAMREVLPAALAALEPRLSTFREQLGSAGPSAADGLWASYREITTEISQIEAASAADDAGRMGDAVERAEAAAPLAEE